MNKVLVFLTVVNYLVLVYSESLEATKRKHNKRILPIKDVKTIFLGKTKRVVPHASGNRPWPTSEVDAYEDPNKATSRYNYETLWRGGYLTLTLVRVENTTKPSHQAHNSKPASLVEDPEEFFADSSPILQQDIEAVVPDFSRHHKRRRQRRRIFGKDSRLEIPRAAVRKVPFSAIVRISTGCTGTLISPQYVLTAAHCVHDNNDYIVSADGLKVGFPTRRKGIRWHRVQYIKVPQGWTTHRDVSFDYAVLRLTRKMRKRIPMEHGSLLQPRRHITSHFLGFHEDKPENSMWYSYCRARPLDHVILNRCDAKPGSSGASIYVVSPKPNGHGVDRIIVGVLSGSGTVRFKNKKIRRFNFATRLTPLKAAQICSWMNNVGSCNTHA